MLTHFAPSASLRSPNQFPSQGRGRVLIPHVKITITHIGALNYVEFRAAMNLTWFMAEGVGFEPTGLSPSGFQDRRLKPLGHPSATDIIKYLHQALSFSP